jgi:hypothetical protein
LAGRRGPPGGLNLSSMKGATKDEGNKFTDYSKIMYVSIELGRLGLTQQGPIGIAQVPKGGCHFARSQV